MDWEKAKVEEIAKHWNVPMYETSHLSTYDKIIVYDLSLTCFDFTASMYQNISCIASLYIIHYEN